MPTTRIVPYGVLFGAFLAMALTGLDADAARVVGNARTAPHRGVWQTELTAAEKRTNPFFDARVRVIFTRPDRSEVSTDAFFRGNGTWVCRAYCDQKGRWTWRSTANLPSLDSRSGSFKVLPSNLPGKLRKHPQDPHQFAFDNGEWFLHVGDTGYRYVTDTEPLWKQYIDEAALAGFTKIRTWFCRSRSNVEALFTKDRSRLDLAYWNEIERRLVYALERYPRIQFQLIPYGEDTLELRRYGKGDRASRFIAEYAQARFSAFPNIHWCISNDRDITTKVNKRSVAPGIINRIGNDMRAREPWGTLMTNHQKRFSGYAFVNAEWSDIITLEDLDEVTGGLLLDYRRRHDDPVVNDEDRYGIYRSPKHDRYFFRRLMWASLLSGAHATYGGLKTYEAFEGPDGTKGVQGYMTAVKDGRLDDGARDFNRIREFFNDAKLTLVGFRPADELAGNDPMHFKAATDGKRIIVYAQNPDASKPEQANVANETAALDLKLPAGEWHPHWYDPRTGKWHKQTATLRGKARQKLTVPFKGDAVLLLQPRGKDQ